MKCAGCKRKLPKGRGEKGELVLCPECAARAAARGQGVDDDVAQAVALEATDSPGAALFLARFAMRTAVDFGAKKLAEMISAPKKRRRSRPRKTLIS